MVKKHGAEKKPGKNAKRDTERNAKKGAKRGAKKSAKKGAALAGAALALAAVLAAWLFFGAAPRLRARTDAPTDADRIGLNVVMHPEDGTCAVTERIAFVNRTGKVLDHTVVRFYLNAFSDAETCPLSRSEIFDRVFPEGFSPGYVTLQGVRIGDAAAECAWLDSLRTALRVSVGPLAPGEECEIVLNYVLTVPECGFRCGRSENVWLLGGAFGVPAVWDDEKGDFRQDPFTALGAPFLADTAVYTVTAVPGDGWQAAASCPLEVENGVLKGREFAGREMAVLFYRGMEMRSAVFGDASVRFAAKKDLKEADRVVRRAAEVLAACQEAYGPCPWDTLTILAAPMAAEETTFPGLIVLSEDLFRGDEIWELPLARGAARQWFGCMAGADRFSDPWQEEALCRWAVLNYGGKKYGGRSRELLEEEYAEMPMRETVTAYLTPGSPLERFEDPDDYETVACGRGTAFLRALDIRMEGGLDGMLRSYAERFAWKRASRRDFEALLAERTGQDLSGMALDYLDTLIR